MRLLRFLLMSLRDFHFRSEPPISYDAELSERRLKLQGSYFICKFAVETLNCTPADVSGGSP